MAQRIGLTLGVLLLDQSIPAAGSADPAQMPSRESKNVKFKKWLYYFSPNDKVAAKNSVKILGQVVTARRESRKQGGGPRNLIMMKRLSDRTSELTFDKPVAYDSAFALITQAKMLDASFQHIGKPTGIAEAVPEASAPKRRRLCRKTKITNGKFST